VVDLTVAKRKEMRTDLSEYIFKNVFQAHFPDNDDISSEDDKDFIVTMLRNHLKTMLSKEWCYANSWSRNNRFNRDDLTFAESFRNQRMDIVTVFTILNQDENGPTRFKFPAGSTLTCLEYISALALSIFSKGSVGKYLDVLGKKYALVAEVKKIPSFLNYFKHTSPMLEHVLSP